MSDDGPDHTVSAGTLPIAEAGDSLPPSSLSAQVPIHASNGSLIGVLAVWDKSPRQLSDTQISLLGTFSRLMAGHLELTDALRLETEQTQELKRILKPSRDLTISVGVDGTMKSVSRACLAILGYKPAELMGRPSLDFVHPDDQERTGRALEAYMQGRLTDRFDNRYLHKDGRAIWLEWSVTTDQVRGLIYLAGRDITGTKEKQRRLAESEQQYRSLIEYNPNPVYRVDAEGRFMQANHAWELLTGYSAAEWIGKSFSPIVEPADLPIVVDVYEKALRGEPAHYEVRLLHKEGHRVWIRGTNLPVIIDGEIVGIYGVGEDVTERKRAEEALQLAKLVAEHSPDVLCLCRTEEGWPLAFVSDTIAQFGYTPAEMLSAGFQFTSIIHPDDLLRVTREVAAYQQAGAERFQHEYRIVNRDGRVRWVEDRTAVVRDGSGEITHHHCTLVDITDRKQVDRRLHESEQLYRSLIANDVDAVLSFDLAGNLLEANAAVMRVSGYAAAELTGQNYRRLLSPESGDPAAEAALAMRERTSHRWEITIEHKAGHAVNLWLILIPIIMHDEVTGLFVVARDITAFKQLEQQLKNNEQRYKSLFDHNPNAVFSMSPDGQILTVNAATEGITGYRIDELLGHAVTPLLASECLEDGVHHFQAALHGEAQHYETTLLHKDGRYIELAVTNSPIVVDGEIVGVYGISRDITSTKMLQRRIREREQWLQSLFALNPDAVISCDTQGNVLHINASCESLVGYDHAELIGKPLARVVSPQTRAQLITRFSQALQGEAQHDVECALLTKDGHTVDCAATVIPVVVQSQVVGVYVIAQDVTERKRATTALRFVADVSAALTAALDPAQALAETARLAVSYIADLCVIHSMVGDHLEPAAAAHADPLQMARLRDNAATYLADLKSPGIIAQAMRTQQPVLVSHIGDQPAAPQAALSGAQLQVQRQLGLRSVMVVPMIVKGRVLGAVTFGLTGSARRFGPTDLAVAEEFCHRAASTLDHLQSYQSAHEAAFHDALTKLPNRALFLNRLEQNVARHPHSEPSFAVLFVDLDDFKDVNDRLGHQPGDQLLIEIAARLQACVRPGDTVARLGGDEFTVLLDDTDSVHDAVRVAERFLDALSRPFTLQGEDVSVTPSIGIALAEFGQTAGEVLRCADVAMYHAKRAGKHGYVVYSPELGDENG